MADTPSTAPTPSPGPTSSTTPLLSLLAGIPEDPISQTEGFIYFVDYSAMDSAYHATRPADAQEFAGISEADEAHKVWWALLRGIAWSYSRYWQAGMETGPAAVGFSPLEVDQAVQFGVPPSDGLMLAGSFDADAIRTAYQANIGLAPKDFDGVTVWCSGKDPEDGLRIDLSYRVVENPFGGELGRRQPMIISDDLLMSSADLELVLAHAGAVAGTVPNLADAPGYRAAVNAVGEDADVLQATIAGLTMALNIAPTFELLVLADVVTGDEQIARLGLVYRDAESAEATAPVLLERLAAYPSFSGRSFAEMLTPSNGTGLRYYVRQESGRAVLVLEFPAPKATSEEIAAMQDLAGYEGTATPPGWAYRRLSDMFLQRDTNWLSP